MEKEKMIAVAEQDERGDVYYKNEYLKNWSLNTEGENTITQILSGFYMKFTEFEERVYNLLKEPKEEMNLDRLKTIYEDERGNVSITSYEVSKIVPFNTKKGTMICINDAVKLDGDRIDFFKEIDPYGNCIDFVRINNEDIVIKLLVILSKFTDGEYTVVVENKPKYFIEKGKVHTIEIK